MDRFLPSPAASEVSFCSPQAVESPHSCPRLCVSRHAALFHCQSLIYVNNMACRQVYLDEDIFVHLDERMDGVRHAMDVVPGLLRAACHLVKLHTVRSRLAASRNDLYV
jgi:hypothetical protein